MLKLKNAAVLMFAAQVLGFCSCNADADLSENGGRFDGAIRSANAVVATVVLPQVIDQPRTLSSDTLYRLDGKVYVSGGAILTIDAGTRIEGVYKADSTLTSALVITRGSQILANGTASQPVVFTSAKSEPAVGDWGGLVILGNARINQDSVQTIEGIDLPFVPDGVDVTYGTPNSDAYNSESSGSLTYVRVEYAGRAIATDNELNSFTFGGVGCGTTLHHLQAYYGADDAFEFFGGTVNAKYLISTAANDDAFDFDFGYTGRLQFLLAVLDPKAPYSGNANGIECDNDASGSAKTPYTRPVISNLTAVGTSDGSTTGGGTVQYGAHFRRNSRFVLANSIFYGYKGKTATPYVIYLESTGTVGAVGTVCNINQVDSSYFCNNVVGLITGANPWNSGWYVDDSDVSVAWSAITLRYPFTYGWFFDAVREGLRPTADPALTGVCFDCLTSGNCGFTFDTVTYKGAVSDANYWITEDWVNTDFPIFGND